MATNPALQRIYELVGESATKWNQVETLWYLIFTGLMHPTDRAKTDVVFGQFQTGAMQRALILAVAQVALKFDVEELKKRNPEHHLRRRMLRSIGQLNARTNTIAGRRNAVVHAAFEDWGNAGIVAMGGVKPSKLRDENHPQYLAELIEDTALLAWDLDELRDQMAEDWLNPSDRENRLVREDSMRDAGYPPHGDARQKAQAELRKAVSQRKQRPNEPSLL